MDPSGRRSKRKLQKDEATAKTKDKDEHYQKVLAEERLKAKLKYDAEN